MPCQQFGFQPGRAVTEQRLAPEHIAQQVRVEDQQCRLLRPCLIFPLQLAPGDFRDISQTSVAGIEFDKPTHVFIHPQAAKALLQARRQPALASGFGAGQDHNLHVRNAGSARHSRKPWIASRVNSPYSAAVRYSPL